jgi:hypothetical protein
LRFVLGSEYSMNRVCMSSFGHLVICLSYSVVGLQQFSVSVSLLQFDFSQRVSGFLHLLFPATFRFDLSDFVYFFSAIFSFGDSSFFSIFSGESDNHSLSLIYSVFAVNRRFVKHLLLFSASGSEPLIISLYLGLMMSVQSSCPHVMPLGWSCHFDSSS